MIRRHSPEANWGIADQIGWIYVSGTVGDLDPVNDTGTKLEVTGKVDLTEQGAEQERLYISGETLRITQGNKAPLSTPEISVAEKRIGSEIICHPTTAIPAPGFSTIGRTF